MNTLGNPIKFKWRGKSHSVQVTFADIREINASVTNTDKIIRDIIKNDLDITDAVDLFSYFLRKVNVIEDAETIYKAFYSVAFGRTALDSFLADFIDTLTDEESKKK